MKKNQSAAKLNYGEEVRKLKNEGPGRLYVIYGEEYYLRERFTEEIRNTVFPDGTDDFSYRRFDYAEVNEDELSDSFYSVPFMSDRVLIEITNIDLNTIKDSDLMFGLLNDIADYCTVVLISVPDYSPDERLKTVKKLRAGKYNYFLNFERQNQSLLINWITRRFESGGKSIGFEAVQALMFYCGDIMSGLIPEIDKIISYSENSQITVKDVEAVANRIPEAAVMMLSEEIALRHTNEAFQLTADILSDKNNDPIFILALLGSQMRKLYFVSQALQNGLGTDYLCNYFNKKDYYVRKLISIARPYTCEELKAFTVMCADADFEMKFSSADSKSILTDLILKISAGNFDG